MASGTSLDITFVVRNSLSGKELGRYTVHPDTFVAAWLLDFDTHPGQPRPSTWFRYGVLIYFDKPDPLDMMKSFHAQGVVDGSTLSLVETSEEPAEYTRVREMLQRKDEERRRGLRYRLVFDQEESRSKAGKHSTDDSPEP